MRVLFALEKSFPTSIGASARFVPGSAKHCGLVVNQAPVGPESQTVTEPAGEKGEAAVRW